MPRSRSSLQGTDVSLMSSTLEETSASKLNSKVFSKESICAEEVVRLVNGLRSNESQLVQSGAGLGRWIQNPRPPLYLRKHIGFRFLIIVFVVSIHGGSIVRKIKVGNRPDDECHGRRRNAANCPVVNQDHETNFHNYRQSGSCRIRQVECTTTVPTGRLQLREECTLRRSGCCTSPLSLAQGRVSIPTIRSGLM
jgi:hypothetical protein